MCLLGVFAALTAPFFYGENIRIRIVVQIRIKCNSETRKLVTSRPGTQFSFFFFFFTFLTTTTADTPPEYLTSEEDDPTEEDLEWLGYASTTETEEEDDPDYPQASSASSSAAPSNK